MGFLKQSTSDIDPASIHPLHDRVLVRIDDRAVTTSGGIAIPHVARDLPNTATVVNVGSAVTCCAAGDRVLIEKYAHGDEEFFVLDGARHLRVKDTQVIAVLDEDEL